VVRSAERWTVKGAALTQGRSDDGAQAAQRRAESAGAHSERNRRRLRADGTAQARDQAARMHDNAATMHERAVTLGIGDSDEHRRSAARHRDAATSHRPPVPPSGDGAA
jgi:hypothetical protein